MSKQNPTPTPGPSESASSPLEQNIHQPNLRERIHAFTDRELDELIQSVETRPNVAEELRNPEIRQAIERRMDELHVTDAVRTQWQNLQANIAARPMSDVEQRAEKHFLQKMVEKGGLPAILASVGITILSWFGFKSAKKLRESIKQKGYLRTAIEGAREHPIFAALIAAMGIKAGSEAYQFLSENSDEIKQQIQRVAGERGVQAAEVVGQVAAKAREAIGKTADMTLKGIVAGITTVLGGTYDEETGVVTIGSATLRPTAIVAWQAGVRRRAGEGLLQKGYSTLLVEDRLHALLRQADVVTKESQGIAGHKKVLAKRALELMADTTPDTNGARKLELERIINTLEPDLGLNPKNAAVNVQTSKQEMERKLAGLEAEMDRIYKTEVDDFGKVGSEVKDTLYQAEKKIVSGQHGGKPDHIKKTAVDAANKRIAEYQDALLAKKLPIAQQIAALATELGDTAPSTGVQAKQGMLGKHIDTATRGEGRVSKVLEGTTRNAEKMGYGIAKVPGGKWVVRSIVGYSMLPLAMEGVASLRTSGPEAAAARKALAVDVAQAGLGFVPGVGDALDIYTAISGKDLNGRELDSWQRTQMAALGTLGAASTVAGFFTGGLSIVGYRALRGTIAAGKAAKVAKMASQGVDVASVTAKSIKAVEKGKDNVGVLESMLRLTELQRKALKVKGFLNNAQRTMQIVTYAQLGYQLVSGAKYLYGKGEDVIEAAHGKVMEGVNAFEHIATPKAS